MPFGLREHYDAFAMQVVTILLLLLLLLLLLHKGRGALGFGYGNDHDVIQVLFACRKCFWGFLVVFCFLHMQWGQGVCFVNKQ